MQTLCPGQVQSGACSSSSCLVTALHTPGTHAASGHAWLEASHLVVDTRQATVPPCNPPAPWGSSHATRRKASSMQSALQMPRVEHRSRAAALSQRELRAPHPRCTNHFILPASTQPHSAGALPAGQHAPSGGTHVPRSSPHDPQGRRFSRATGEWRGVPARQLVLPHGTRQFAWRAP